MSCTLDVEANPTNVMVGEALPDIFCPWMEPIVIGMNTWKFTVLRRSSVNWKQATWRVT